MPFPSPMHERKRKSEVAQSCLTLSDPMDCSLPGSFFHGIVQARVLEWVAIAFSTPLLSVMNIFFFTFLCSVTRNYSHRNTFIPLLFILYPFGGTDF